jgi:hypothetical protein
MHQVEGVVDRLKRHGVGDQVIDVDLALHVPVDDFRHVSAAARAAEGGAAPDAAGDQLERARGDLLSVDQLYKKLTGPILFGRSSPADAATPALEGCKNRGASPCAIRHARVKRPTRNNRAAAWARRTSASSRQ